LHTCDYIEQTRQKAKGKMKKKKTIQEAEFSTGDRRKIGRRGGGGLVAGGWNMRVQGRAQGILKHNTWCVSVWLSPHCRERGKRMQCNTKRVMRQLAIITDDLSSATDCGIQVARSGLHTVALLGQYEPRPAEELAEVISINTESRTIPAREAYEVVRKETEAMMADGFEMVYKSLDSTLRGNLGAEVDAVMDAGDFDLAVVAPAFPHYGRTTVHGRHFLHGTPLTQTEFATDPQDPVIEDDLARLFGSQSKRGVGLVELDTLRAGETGVLDRLTGLKAQGVELAIFDAEVETDLDRIVRTVSNTGYRVLWVGSTGLVRCVGETLPTDPTSTAAERHSNTRYQTMLVAGSASDVTREQIVSLECLPGIVCEKMNVYEIVSGATEAEKELDRCRRRLAGALADGHDIGVYVSSSRAEITGIMARGHQQGFDTEATSSRITAALARLAGEMVRAGTVTGLILTGGDTARAVCNELGGKGITLLDEVEPGIGIGRLIGETELLLVIKAGAFGTPQALVKAYELLKKD